MARGSTLATIRLMLRAEIGQTMNTSAGTQGDARLNQLLSNKQKWLASEYDWPFLEQRWTTTIGARFVPVPTVTDGPDAGSMAVNFERPVRLETKFNNKWCLIEYGIGSEEYNALDSEEQQPEDPIQRWRFATNVDDPVNPGQIEVWPLPATSNPLRITGQRALLTLSADSDTADLDDVLLAYFVAGDLMMEKDMENAQMKIQMAQRRLQQLRQVYPDRDEKLVLGKNYYSDPRRLRRLVPIVAVHN
jgi:hypothetical protein